MAGNIRTLKGHDYWVSFVTFSPDGNLLASSNGDDTVKLWRVSNGRDIRTIKGHPPLIPVIFSPDGSMLASGSWDDTVKLWRVSDGQEIRTLKGHDHWVNSVTFSPDGSMLASGSSDDTVKLWRVSDGQKIRTLKGHRGPVTSVSFSPDGSLLAAVVGLYGTIKLWRVSDGREIRTLKHDNEVRSMIFSPDGSMLVFGYSDEIVRLWQWDITVYVYQEAPGTPEYRISKDAFASEIRTTPLAPAWELFAQHGPEALAYYKEHGLEAARLNASFNMGIAPDDIKAILNSPSP